MKKRRNIYNMHHLIPQSRWWTNNDNNLLKLKKNIHTSFHTIFNNYTPREQLIHLVHNINYKVFSDQFKQDIMKILNVTDDKYFYKEDCLK